MMLGVDRLTVGPWEVDARVETTPYIRFREDEPLLGNGDLWYRIVIALCYSDDTGETGLEGELATPWLWNVNAAAEQAKLLSGLVLAWVDYDEGTDEYIRQESGEQSLVGIVDSAV